MNRFVAFAFAAAINAALLGLLQWSSVVAQRAPHGEVSITELPTPEQSRYAQLSSGEVVS